jgi:hypothetical protein
MIHDIIKVLFPITSLICAILLFRAFARRRTRLLFWSGAAFSAFAISNVLLFVDFALVPAVDLSLLRGSMTALGLGVLLWGLIWEDAR